MRSYIRFLLSIIAAISAALAMAGASASTVFDYQRLGHVIASPDNIYVAYIAMQAKPDRPCWYKKLYLYNIVNGQFSVISKNNFTASQPRWSPDGSILAFLAKGNKHLSIWFYNLKKKSQHKFFEGKKDIDTFKWSPDGKKIAFTVINSKTLNLQLFVIAADNKSIPRPKTITPENINIRTAGNSDEYVDTGYDWSPDSRSLGYAHTKTPSAAAINTSKITLVNLITQVRKNISYTEKHTGNQVFYSPKGQWLAFSSNLPPQKKASRLANNIELNNRICVVNLLSLKTHCLANTFNKNPMILGWNQQGNGIYVNDFYKTKGIQFYVLKLDKASPPVRQLNHQGNINPLSITLNQSRNTFGFALETPSKAPEAFIASTNNSKLKQISQIQNVNQDPIGQSKTIHWKSFDGKIIEGVLITPPNYDPLKTYPLAVLIHGGPTGVWSERYVRSCWGYESYVIGVCLGDLLNRGFVILQPNPRGSTGYGLNFRLANFGDFGGGDFKDIMTGVDFLIRKKIADPDHMVVFGWSYGGYLTAWAITQTNRFKVAIEGSGLADLISFSGTTDIPNYLIEFLGKPFWQDHQLYQTRSPIMFVQNIKTPLLIIGGENDIRVPFTQGKELFSALKLQKKSVELMMMKKQGHAPSNPIVIHDVIQKVNYWFDKALR